MTTIGFIGLGNMGLPMARNLLKAGFTLKVFDIVKTGPETLAAEGATVAISGGDAAAQADVVITMLPAGAHVETAYLAPGDILDSAKTGALLIDCSTIEAGTARKVAEAAASRGFAMLDAPVSGGTAGAAAGTLTFIVGGAAAALEQARPVLEKMGKNIFHAGPAGAGQIAKICNNMLLGVLMIGTSEALNLGMRHGLDPKRLSEIMGKSSGRNWALEVYNPVPGIMENVPASRDYAGGFGSALMVKDLSLAMKATEAASAAAPLGRHALEIFEAHAAAGGNVLDFSSVYRWIACQPVSD